MDRFVGFFGGGDFGRFGGFGDSLFAGLGELEALLAQLQGAEAGGDLGDQAQVGRGHVGAGAELEEAVFEVFMGGVQKGLAFSEAKGGGVLGAGFLGIGDAMGGVESAEGGLADF